MGWCCINKKQIFIQFEPKIKVKPGEEIRLMNIASVFCKDKEIKDRVLDIFVIKASDKAKSQVISSITIIEKIYKIYDNVDIIIYGGPEILIDIQVEKDSGKLLQIIKVIVVCLILSLGSAIAIINFHVDVGMEDSLKSIYTLVTGDKVKRPSILMVPYSLGIGIGMAIFFNNIFKKKWKKEPSPLEVEMRLYEKNMDEYILDETKHNKRK
ncbi:stage V sporulation protein AA [Dethiothermospora halolimnae]|uniref:stage V sporulation protein AA n=1 Tax=Dethiothermospora halolimnae TaxID=3114390 RepID=UPI003CCC29D3